MNNALIEKMDNIKNMTIKELAEKYKCKQSEICMGDYIARETDDVVCPYKVILGFANFEQSKVVDLGKLEIVYGKILKTSSGYATDIKQNPICLGLNLKNSKITNLGKLRKVYGLMFLNDNIKSLGNITYLGSNLNVNNSNLEDFGALKIINGVLSLEDDLKPCKIKSFGKLEKIKYLNIRTKSIKDLGELQEIGYMHIAYNPCHKVSRFFESNFKFINNKFVRVEKEYQY